MALLVYFTGVISLKNVTARKLLEGEPVIVVQNGKILEKNMSRVRYNQDDLMMQLREKGVFDYSEVEYAIMEPHGQLSVLKKSPFQPVTTKDLNLPSNYKGISIEIVRDGRIQERNLKQHNLTHEWLYSMLMTLNVSKIEDIFLATLSSDGQLYIDLKKDDLNEDKKIEDDDSIVE